MLLFTFGYLGDKFKYKQNGCCCFITLSVVIILVKNFLNERQINVVKRSPYEESILLPWRLECAFK